MMRFSAFVVLSSMALCAHAGGQNVDTQSTPPAATGGNSAVVVGIDAKTGKLRQLSDAEIQQLSQAADKAMPARRGANDPFSKMPRTEVEARATMRMNAKGMMTMQVPESAMSSLSATRAADGSISFSEDEGRVSPVVQEVLK